MICVFIFIYANTTGPIAWVYSAETCTDVGLGVCLLTLWAVVLLEVLTVPTLMNTPIETSGVFFMFTIFGIISAVFVFFFLKETKGLTDQEKRNLYAPKSINPEQTEQEFEFSASSTSVKTTENDKKQSSKRLFIN